MTNYIVKNQYGQLTITLLSNISQSLKLDFKRNGTSQTSINSTTTAEGDKTRHKWVIPLNQFSLGDELTEFKVTFAGVHHLWEMNEGITILLNGNEIDTVRSNTWTHTFDTNGSYNIQAVYKGNHKYAMASTDDKKCYINIPTPAPSPTPTPSEQGEYSLQFYDKNITKMGYKDNTKIRFQLKRGGKPAVGKIVQRVYPPPHDTATAKTDTNGIVTMTNSDWKVGKWKIGCHFSLNGKLIDSKYKTITVSKTDAVITYTKEKIYKGQKLQIHFKEKNSGDKITNEKVSIYINGKAHNKKINKNGNVWIKMNHTGTFKFKVVYKGNDSVNKETIKFTKVVKVGA